MKNQPLYCVTVHCALALITSVFLNLLLIARFIGNLKGLLVYKVQLGHLKALQGLKYGLSDVIRPMTSQIHSYN